jgi:hypothetical protein
MLSADRLSNPKDIDIIADSTGIVHKYGEQFIGEPGGMKVSGHHNKQIDIIGQSSLSGKATEEVNVPDLSRLMKPSDHCAEALIQKLPPWTPSPKPFSDLGEGDDLYHRAAPM